MTDRRARAMPAATAGATTRKELAWVGGNGMPRKKGHQRGAGKHATGQRKGKGASLRVVEQRDADAAAAPAAAAQCLHT